MLFFSTIFFLQALPSELALHILSYVPWQVLLKCSLVSRRWRALADDNSLWQGLCEQRGWAWRWPSVPHSPSPIFRDREEEFDDEGMGDDEDSESDGHGSHTQIVVYEPPSQPHGFIGLPPTPRIGQHRRAGSPKQPRRSSPAPSPAFSAKSQTKFRPFYYRHSAPSVLPSAESPKPNYKLLHQTRVLLSNRLLHGAFRFSTLQTRGTPNAHTSIIYCLQLYTYEDSGRQVLFTGSKDRTVCEWNLTTGTVERVFEGVHTGSVLSLCAHGSFLASAGSDWRVCVWDLRDGTLVHTIMDHQESVLCVRFDAKRLVSCSKDRTVRMYRFTENQNNTKISTPGQPVLGEGTILGMHRVAVNAVALSGALVVSASGDKSLRLWDADTGALLRTIEGHHTRGIAAIDIAPPLVLSGSSDKHIRLFDIERRRGWSTFPDFHDPLVRRTAQGVVCKTCGGVLGGESGDQGGGGGGSQSRRASVAASDAHTDLVRSVAIGSDFVLSGSYDQSIKVTLL